MGAANGRPATGKKDRARAAVENGALPPARPDPPAPLQQVSRYCICGAALDIAVVARVVPQVEDAWRRVHSGPRHHPAPSPVEDPLQHTDQILGELTQAKHPAR